jgi:hypothetical protein
MRGVTTWTEKERKNASYIGRNGAGKCMGVEVFHTTRHFISIQPINSKNCIASSCLIQIPLSHVNKICDMMQGNLLDTVLTNLKDQLPRLLGLDPDLDVLVANKLKESK